MIDVEKHESSGWLIFVRGVFLNRKIHVEKKCQFKFDIAKAVKNVQCMIDLYDFPTSHY